MIRNVAKASFESRKRVVSAIHGHGVLSAGCARGILVASTGKLRLFFI